MGEILLKDLQSRFAREKYTSVLKLKKEFKEYIAEEQRIRSLYNDQTTKIHLYDHYECKLHNLCRKNIIERWINKLDNRFEFVK